MKKIIVGLSLLLILTLALGTVGLAANDYVSMKNHFDKSRISCVVGNYTVMNDDYSYAKTSKIGEFYVKHFVDGDYGTVETNLFKAQINGNGDTLYGNKWMPQGSYYIVSGSFISGCKAKVVARGNTNYGVSSIHIGGFGHPNAGFPR